MQKNNFLQSPIYYRKLFFEYFPFFLKKILQMFSVF